MLFFELTLKVCAHYVMHNASILCLSAKTFYLLWVLEYHLFCSFKYLLRIGLLYMYEDFACISVWCPRRTEEGMGAPAAGVIDAC